MLQYQGFISCVICVFKDFDLKRDSNGDFIHIVEGFDYAQILVYH